MSSSINALNGNGMSLQFEEFARLAGTLPKSSSVVRFLGTSDAASVHEVAVTTSDKVGKWFRSGGVKAANDTTRAIFRQSVAAMFGGESHIPDNVLKAMKLDDYGKGKPLTTKRIQIVKLAVDEAMKMFPVERPRISAPTAHVRQAGQEGGPLSAKDVTDKGYAPGELNKLSKVADMYQQVTTCSLEEAQSAALDPKSDASRLYGYGGAFTANTENFKKGLDLIDKFSTWFDGFVKSSANTASLLKPGDRLGVEKFVFEEIGCNPELFKEIDNPESAFGPEKNLAMRFILDEMMQSISGSMSGISPEKRSVVFAVTQALRENGPAGGKGHPFSFNSAILSRTLANFGKVAELVYSGNLNRATAFDTLFPDLKKLGLSGNNTNTEIRDVVKDELLLSQETAEAEKLELKTGDHGPVKELIDKSHAFGDLFNTTGASIQDCKRAVLNGQVLPMAVGMNNISSDKVADFSGFSDGGRNQFLGDIHRPLEPYDAKTKQPIIAKENNVFRFNIGGQDYTANATKDPAAAKNEKIAEAIEKLCNAKVHPVQTSTVFFSLAQGGLMPQTTLASHGYLAVDHGPITFTITKDAQTGSINIKYSNPEGSPLKFSWTATVDVDGKVVSTPIQVEKD